MLRNIFSKLSSKQVVAFTLAITITTYAVFLIRTSDYSAHENKFKQWAQSYIFPTNLSSDNLNALSKNENKPCFEEILKYFFEANSSSCRVAADFGFVLGRSDTMGMAPDGNKAVCFDPGVRPTYNNCLVYSFGIRDEWSFDEAMENYGCNVYAFDPSMSAGDHRHSDRILFYKLGLSGKNVDKDPATSWKLKTLSSIYEMLLDKHGPRVIDYLKIDIEFSEWLALPQIYESNMLERVKQIGMDVHMRSNASIDTFRKYYKTIRSLEQDHGFYRFSSRTNVWARVFMDSWGRMGNYAFEMAWYNSRFTNQSFVNDPYTFWK